MSSLLNRTCVLLLVLAGCITVFSSHSTVVPVTAETGMVVTSHHLASKVGVDTLKDGGNVMDAAVATAFALAVTLPSAGNLGGGGFLVYHGADGEVTSFDFREKAPMAATERMFLDESGKIRDNCNHEGLLSVGVPGTVAGLWLAHQRLGRAPWKSLVQPAIELAEDGFPVSQKLHNDIVKHATEFREYPTSAQVFLKPDLEPYEAGDIWKQPHLAATLKTIQTQGRDGFYRGRVAMLLASMMEREGGLITMQDLVAYEAVERPPVQGTYRGYDIYAMGPPSSGGVALIEMLNILEGFRLSETDHNSPDYLHILAETMRRAFRDRARFLGDPDFNPEMPIGRLLSKERAAELRSTIDLSRASKSDLAVFERISSGTHTTHFSIADSTGNVVSLTYTIEQSYGSKIVAEGAGYLLNNEMGDFNPFPGQTDNTGLIGTEPNLAAPGKRMLSSMTPTILAKDGKPILAIGSPGGRTIINTVLQIVLNIVDRGMNVAEAIEAGRIHHQWLPDEIAVEERLATDELKSALDKMGHRVKNKGSSQGEAMGLFLNHSEGALEGWADSRSADGAAVGY